MLTAEHRQQLSQPRDEAETSPNFAMVANKMPEHVLRVQTFLVQSNASNHSAVIGLVNAARVYSPFPP
jgi:hypothetical protein